ncbi:GtrA family protein [Embleya sp. AB8]|uniref:GtrA family protein n=1 Tax=Embleya sp. AB8 TaxID=3156304 RepID=UPI003C7886C2
MSRGKHTDEAAGRVAKSGSIAAFARFVAFGGGTGIASSGALVVLTGTMPIAVANAFVTVISTVAATELHSRYTFGGGRAGLRAHGQSALSAVVAYLFTTAAVLGLHTVAPGAGVLVQQGVYLGASGLAGIGRFAVLRLFVFTRPGTRPRPVRALARAQVIAAA